MLKENLIRAALVIFGITIALLAFEFGARLIPPSLLPIAARQLIDSVAANAPGRRPYSIDPQLGFIYKPATDYTVEHPDFTFRIKTNLNTEHAGFRGGTRAGPTWAVAVGDSFTFGVGVNQENTWEALLADKIERDVVNLGVSGWAPQQYTLALEKFGIPLSPRVIFYGLYANDLADSVRFKNHGGRFDRFSVRIFLTNYSIIYNLFKKLGRKEVDSAAEIPLPEVGWRFSVDEVTQSFLKEGRYTDRGWELIVREVARVAEASQKIDAKLVLLYFPSSNEVYWEQIKKKASFPSVVEERVGAMRKRFAELCQSRQLLCLDVTPALKQQVAQSKKLYFAIDNHWTESGHAVLANELYRFLSLNKLL
jgi:hypothetical protein